MDLIIRDIDAVIGMECRRCDIAVSEGLFSDLSPRGKCTELDGKGLIAVPGFIDTHIHGTGGYGTEDGQASSIIALSRVLAGYGVTSFFPTVYAASPDTMARNIRAIADAAGSEGGARIAGIHIEGPFISPDAAGAQDRSMCIPFSKDMMLSLIEAGKGLVKAMTCAPEISGIEELAAMASEHGIVLLMGHTKASYDEAERGRRLGIHHAAHLFNAMPAIHQREPGAAGCILFSQDMTAEMIPDGHHVHPAFLRFAVKAMGCGRIAAVSDAIRPAGLEEGKTEANGKAVRMCGGMWVSGDGIIQGSSLTMAKAFRNLIGWGFTVPEAAALTSSTPAAVYGLSDRGRIGNGLKADLVVMDSDLRIRFTIINGGIVCGTAS